MAEIGIAASLVQIAGAGIQLTRTLYEFAATTSAARDQVDYVGKNVSFYSDVLELLVEQFEHERPIHSRKAIALAEKLYDHSYDLFNRIGDLIPDRRRTRDQISFIQRIAWNFKKTRVALLVGELENLKSTVHLLVQVLCAARQIRAYNEDTRRDAEKSKKREAARRQYLRAGNVLVEWQRTQESLLLLQEAADRDNLYSIQAAYGSNNELVPATSNKSYAWSKSRNSSLAVIEAAAATATGSESDKRALVLRNTKEWLEMLVDDWTVLSPQPWSGREDAHIEWRTALSSAERRVSLRPRISDRGESVKFLSAIESDRQLDVNDPWRRVVEPELGRDRMRGAPAERLVSKRRTKASANNAYPESQQGTLPSAKSTFHPEISGSTTTTSDARDTSRSKIGPRRYQYVDDGSGDEEDAHLPPVASNLPPLREPARERNRLDRSTKRPVVEENAAGHQPFFAPIFNTNTNQLVNASGVGLDPLSYSKAQLFKSSHSQAWSSYSVPGSNTSVPAWSPSPILWSDPYTPLMGRQNSQATALRQPVKAINGRYFFECPELACDSKGERAFLNWEDLQEHLEHSHFYLPPPPPPPLPLLPKTELFN